jgi:hypothetical protein
MTQKTKTRLKKLARKLQNGKPTRQIISKLEEIIYATAYTHEIQLENAILQYDDEMEAFVMKKLVEVGDIECYIVPKWPRLPLWLLKQRAEDPDTLLEDIAYFIKQWQQTLNTYFAKQWQQALNIIINTIELERCRE